MIAIPAWLGQRERGSRLLMAVVVTLTLKVGRPVGRALLYPICAYFLLFSKRARVASRAYLARVLGRAPSWRERFRHYHCFAGQILDRVPLLAGDLDRFDCAIEGLELLEAMAAATARRAAARRAPRQFRDHARAGARSLSGPRARADARGQRRKARQRAGASQSRRDQSGDRAWPAGDDARSARRARRRRDRRPAGGSGGRRRSRSPVQVPRGRRRRSPRDRTCSPPRWAFRCCCFPRFARTMVATGSASSRSPSALNSRGTIATRCCSASASATHDGSRRAAGRSPIIGSTSMISGPPRSRSPGS